MPLSIKRNYTTHWLKYCKSLFVRAWQRCLFLFIVLSNLLIANAQISFTKLPLDFSLIPRNPSTNTGVFETSGLVVDTKYTAIELRCYLKGVLKNKIIKNLSFTSSVASYNLALTVGAGKYNYDFYIYLNQNNMSTLITQVRSVVFGDMILITGQSNAVANSYNGTVNSTYSDSFIRSFGTASTAGSLVAGDLAWHLANGDGYYDKGTVGQWGLVMAKQLMDSMKIPIGLINNAVGGTPISFHQKNKGYATDLNTSYGRHLFRAIESGCAKKARFMFFYQGESDGSSARLHDSLFRVLHADWLSDFPGIEKVYAVQVRSGCGGPSLALREAQRQFEFVLPLTRTLTMTGFNGHDGCHFALKNGYESLGFEAANCLLTEFYSKKNKTNIYPLNPIYAYFSKADHTQITLELNQHSQTLKADANFYQLFQLEGTPGVWISGGNILNNKIVLNLSSKVCSIQGLSYDGKPGAQPWVTNSNGVGLLSFYNLPVHAVKRFGGIINLCQNEFFTPKIDTIAGNSYLWRGKTSGIVSKKAWPTLKPKQSEAFELIIQDLGKLCKADTQLFYLNIDSISNPNLPPTVHLCQTDTLQLIANYQAKRFIWKKDNVEISTRNSIRISEKGLYTLDVFSTFGCLMSDTTLVTHSTSKNLLDSLYTICKDNEITLKIKPIFAQYRWNNSSANQQDTFKAKKGTLRVQVTDSAGCSILDTARIENFISPNYTFNTQPEFCDYSPYLYFKPALCRKWYINNREIDSSFYYLTKKDSCNLSIEDSNHCFQAFVLKPTLITKPIQLKYNFMVCSGKTIQIQLLKTSTYQWDDGYFGDSRKLTNAGKYVFTAIHSYCQYKDSLTVWQPQKPFWNLPADTIICRGTQLKFLHPKTIKQVESNTVLTGDTLIIQGEGYYKIRAIDTFNCWYSWDISVADKLCINQANGLNPLSIVLSPNPVNDYLILSVPSTIDGFDCFSLFDINGKEFFLPQYTKHGHSFTFNLSNIPSGIYFLKIYGYEKQIYKKIFKL